MNWIPFSEQELHAILVHFPIALAIAGVPLVYITAVAVTDRVAFRWTSVVVYLVVAAGAYASLWSGERARSKVPNNYPDEVWATLGQTLDLHERLAHTVWIAALVTAGFVLLGAVNVKWVRIPAMTIAMISSIATAGLVGITGHYGGQLVYKYGVGTPGAAHVFDTSVDTPQEELNEVTAPVPTEDVSGVDGEALPAPPAPPAVVDGDVVPPSPDAAAQGNPPIRPISLSEAEAVSYVRDIKPIMEAYCNECHDEVEADGGLILTTVEDMRFGGEKEGDSIVPGSPDESPLILYVRGILKPQMPKREPPLSEDDVHTLRMWIQAGAVDDSQPTGDAIATGEEPSAVTEPPID